MGKKAHITKKNILAIILVLCFAMPFISPIIAAYITTYHTHVCHNNEHMYDCDGTNDCCKICYGIYNVKDHTSYYGVIRKSPEALTLTLPSFADAFRHQLISSVSLVTLKVRLNN